MIRLPTGSIPRRILASLLAIYATTYVATAIVVYSSARESTLHSKTNELHQLAELKYERLVNLFEAAATDVTAWSQLEVMNDLVSGDIDKRVARTLEGLKRLYRLDGDLDAFDATGKLLASTREVPELSLPAGWQGQPKHLVLLGKHQDPIAKGEIVALEIPVFGSFDRNYQVGTLVLSYPWPVIEKRLFSGDSGTILIETEPVARILASDPSPIPQRVADPLILRGDKAPGDFIVGRSVPANGILAGWQVLTLQNTSVVTRLLWKVSLELALLGFVLGVPILALGRWLSNRLTAPVMELTRVVREIADTDQLQARVPVSSSDELGTLARSFNRMTENLERATKERQQSVRDLEALNQTLEIKVAIRTAELKEALSAQQRLIGDISHEIKSPLARLNVALGLARRAQDATVPKQFDRMEREVTNISALASELLTLARLDGGADAVTFAPVDLVSLVRQIVEDAVFELPQRQQDVAVHLPDGRLAVEGNADLLRRAIENVVRNALFYTEPRTPIEIVLACRGREGVRVTVADRGPGVPANSLAHLFEPFYRVDEARARKTGGSGIGLAICQRVAILHGGTATARGNEPHGLVVQIDLPEQRAV